MQAIKAQPFQAPEAAQRKPLANSALSQADAAAQSAKKNADKAAAAKAAEKPPEQRPTTNSQGQTIGLRLNVSA